MDASMPLTMAWIVAPQESLELLKARMILRYERRLNHIAYERLAILVQF
jgi:hypothetical protein